MSSIGSDTFTRSNQSGFGTASGGGTWTQDLGTATLSILSNEGHATGATNSNKLHLGSTSADMQVLVRFKVSATSDIAGVVLRSTASNTHYAITAISSTVLRIAKTVSGTFTQLATATISLSAATKYWLRGEVVGDTIYAKFWADGSVEPAAWTLSITDTSITTAGNAGLAFTLHASGDTVDFDSFSANTVNILSHTYRPKFYTRTTQLVEQTHGRFLVGIRSPFAIAALSYGPKVYYRLNETSGTNITDLSGNGHSGTVSGVSAYSQAGAIFGDSDTSMLFTSGGGVAFPQTLLQTMYTAATLVYWISVTEGWQMVAIAADATSEILYLNGTTYSTGSGVDDLVVDTGLAYSGIYGAGYLDEVLLYNYKLTSAQINNLYTQASKVWTSQLRAIFKIPRIPFSPATFLGGADGVDAFIQFLG